MTKPDKDVVLITLTSLGAIGFLALVLLAIAKCCKQLITRPIRSGNQQLLCESTSSASIATEMHELQPYVPAEPPKSWRRSTLVKRDQRTTHQENLLLLKKLADGRYGAIYEAELYDSSEHTSTRKVVAKLLQAVQVELIKQFEDDIAQLSKFNHRNMVGLLAQFTQEVPKCYVMDYGQLVDLLEYMRNLKNKSTIHRMLQESSDLTADETEEDESMIENAVSIYEELLMDLLIFADHISLGMAYLASLNYIHKDLALRNCIIGYDNVVKVTTDTELAKVRYPEAYSAGQPIRWMSPESLFTGTFTVQSDVWSYGIVLWELITLGELPYSPITDDALISAITTNSEFSLEQPVLCSESLFAVMTQCWSRRPISRPSFVELHEQIYKLTISS